MSKSLDRLKLLETFVRIADAGSISAAARDLGLSQPSASRQLAELETRLRTQLVRRNTHSLSLTGAGIALLADARALLDDWEALEEKHLEREGGPAGTLKVVVPVALGQTRLGDLAWRFQKRYPELSLNWLLEDQPIRFSELGSDCWIRVGPVPDDTLVVRPLGTVERPLVASAGFAQRHEPGDSPEAVGKLDLLAVSPFEGATLSLYDDRGRNLSIEPPLRLQSNNIAAVKAAVASGLGMAVLPRWFVDEELDSNVFVDLLPGCRAAGLPGCRAGGRRR